MQEAIKRFAETEKYTPAPLGNSVQLLSLAIKEKRKFHRPHNTFIGNLQDIAKSEVLNQLEAVLAKRVRERSDERENAAKTALTDPTRTFSILNRAIIKLKRSRLIDNLEFGKLTEDYIEEKDLRELLQIVDLDRNWVKEYNFTNQTLFLVTGVVHSEKIQLRTKPKGRTEFNLFLPGFFGFGANYTSNFPSMLLRETKGPLMFKDCKVEYDSKENRLRLAKDHLARNAAQ